MATVTPQTPLGLFGTDALIDEESLAIRDTVRRFVEEKVRPEISDWYETGAIPARDLAKELGSLGVLGMHLEGYGCAGTTATAYGLARSEITRDKVARIIPHIVLIRIAISPIG